MTFKSALLAAALITAPAIADEPVILRDAITVEGDMVTLRDLFGIEGEAGDTRFLLTDNDTLEFLRGRLEQVGRDTTDYLRTADLDASQELPKAPWFEPGARWTVRRIALHLIAEMSQHAGHADIIRESIDGQKTMG